MPAVYCIPRGFLNVDRKRLASEIPTHMLNPQKFIISDFKFSLHALVICGLSRITKIVTRNGFTYPFLVFCNFVFPSTCRRETRWRAIFLFLIKLYAPPELLYLFEGASTRLRFELSACLLHKLKSMALSNI